MSSKLLGWVILLYFIGGLTYLVAAVFQQNRLNTIARASTLLGWAAAHLQPNLALGRILPTEYRPRPPVQFL